MGRTSIVLIKFSVSASSSHLHSSSLSGLVATTLRGPMGASETSLEGYKSEEIQRVIQWNGVRPTQMQWQTDSWELGPTGGSGTACFLTRKLSTSV